MFGPLQELFETQRRRRAEDAMFASRLHPKRTVFLAELLRDVRDPDRLALLRAPWFDVPRFVARVAAACVFLDAVARADGMKGWAGMPLVFFQSGSESEDAKMHADRSALAGGRYHEACGHLPPAAQYLHLETNFASQMQGRYRRGRLVIAPHFGLAPSPGNLLYDAERRPFRAQGLVLGYRLTDFAALLDVSPLVATDYFARVVVHDLCHYFLPSTPTLVEGFHNVAALSAMGELPPIPYAGAWERLVHAECTDPAFCLRAGGEIDAFRRQSDVLSVVQGHLLAGFERWYVHPNAERKRVQHWGLPAIDDVVARSDALGQRIRAAQADGFDLYRRLMSP